MTPQPRTGKGAPTYQAGQTYKITYQGVLWYAVYKAPTMVNPKGSWSLTKPVKPGSAPTGATPPSGGGGGGGGGGSSAPAKAAAPVPSKIYAKYIQKIGLASNSVVSGLIKKAQKGDWDLAYFDQQLRMNATKAYANSIPGREVTAKFHAEWGSLLSGNPTRNQAMTYLRGYKGGGMSTDQMMAYIKGTKQWGAQYTARGYNVATRALRNNPLEFQSYWDQYRTIMQGYGHTPVNAESRLFFGGHQDIGTFKSAADTVFGGAQSYADWQGNQLTRNQTNAALYGGKAGLGAANLRSVIAKSFQAVTDYQKAPEAQWGTGLNDAGRVVQQGVFK